MDVEKPVPDGMVREAQRLLRNGNLTVLEVARLLGYRSHNHFMVAFATQTGLTPRAYISRWVPRSIAATGRPQVVPGDLPALTARKSALATRLRLPPAVEPDPTTGH